MKNSGICAPIHPKHFTYGVNLISSYNQYYEDDHIFLVFSNQQDADLFRNNNPNLRYQTLIYEGCANTYGYDNGIIHRKKFYGLTQIYKNTNLKYVGVIDIECEFVKHLDYSVLFEEYYNKRTLYCHPSFNNVNLLSGIHQNCICFFTQPEQDILNEMFIAPNNKFNYFWFNDIPVYERDRFQKFTDTVCDYNHPYIHELTFDFVCYAYWLCLTNQFKLEHINADVLWSIGEASLNVEHFKIIKPMWVRKSLDVIENVYLPDDILENVFIKFHIDRSH